MKVEHVCPFCGSKELRSPQAIAENPFCANCLHDRVNLAIAPRCPTCERVMDPIPGVHMHYAHCNNVVELKVVRELVGPDWVRLTREHVEHTQYRPTRGDMVHEPSPGNLASSGLPEADKAPKLQPHRWSGWPGAWCLDCGIEDPSEHCIAVHDFDTCTRPECKHMPCPEPGSKRHDPYYRRATMRAVMKEVISPKGQPLKMHEMFVLTLPKDAEIAAFGEDASKELALWFTCGVRYGKDEKLVPREEHERRSFALTLTHMAFEEGWQCVGTALHSGHVMHLLEAVKLEEPSS